MTGFTLHEGDCLEVMKTLADNSIDAVVTDPPYELGFMGKGWDSTGIANNPALWSEVLRVLKPGGHVAAFSSTRTYHRMACAIEDAGFEVRDQLAWTYGTGFPKSMDISKAIDKQLGVAGTYGEPKSAAHAGWIDRGAMRGDEGHEGYQRPWMQDEEAVDRAARKYEGGSGQARQWEGWGTALKPAWEPICLARKPLSEKTVAANVLRWGTGGLNIDACRIEGRERTEYGLKTASRSQGVAYGEPSASADFDSSKGRFPANLCHDGSQEVLDLFPSPHGAGSACEARFPRADNVNVYGKANTDGKCGIRHGDSGSAARFFYHAKASKHDRCGSRHPTVKPVSLMQWLCRMVTPPAGIVLDPFAGSGTTGAAAILEGFHPLLIEREDEYVADIQRRMGGSPALEPALSCAS